MGNRLAIKGGNAIDYEKRLHAVEMRYETQLRRLEEDKVRLVADLETRFQELGTLTKIMAQKEEEAASREADLIQQLADLRTTLEQMQQSTSWRITRPLRWIIRRVRAR